MIFEIIILNKSELYHLYVIELRKKVFTENKKFREANPQFNGVLECLYVGMTSKTPQERFDQHIGKSFGKYGQTLSSSIVKKYGLYLRPSLYADLPKYKSRMEALKAEKALANDLRRSRYAVWVN
jgi:predicted GIY-YIG superfamily endonuclease